jgi:hypothetical protein
MTTRRPFPASSSVWFGALGVLGVSVAGLLACSRDGNQAKPDEAAQSEAKKKPKPTEDEVDPCLAGAQPPTWKSERVVQKEPKVELEYPKFSSKCASVAKDLTASFEKKAKESRADYERQWKEAKGEPTPFNLEAWELVDTCKPAHVSARVVSVKCEGSQYTGGAHGMYGTGGYSFAIDGRKVRELKLEELFDDTKAWKKPLGERIAKQVNVRKKADGWDPIGGDAVEPLLGTFVLEDASIGFYFAPYALGSFAEGEYVATLTYAELDDLLAKSGPVSKIPRKKP